MVSMKLMSDLKMRIISVVTALFIAGILLPVTAFPDEKAEAVIRAGLKKMLPASDLAVITPTPATGIYEVVIGSTLFYATEDGRYLMQGNLIDLSTHENLSETRRKSIRADLVNALDDDSLIVFKANKQKHIITVFTDIDCGYCRKLHNKMDQYNEKGITVRYMLFPRAGVNSPSYDKAVSVWCSEDRKKAMTQAKAGRKLPLIKCDNPVAEQMEIGNQAGVRATPTIILSDGDVVRGYMPPARLSAVLDARL